MECEDDESMRGYKTEVVIRKYGLLAPHEWTDHCESEMRLMDIFWNKLVDIHEEYVLRYLRQITADQDFAIAKLEYETALASQTSSSELPVLKKSLAVAQQIATRRMAVELRELETSRREDVKIARQKSGLWWGNYNAIVRSFERARSAAIRSGGSLRRRFGDDNGRITNTLQGGVDVEFLFDGSLSQIMVRPPAGLAWSAESRGKRRRLQRTTLTATVFVRDGERCDVTWPMIMHRPIPPDCRVKEVIVTRRRKGERWQWAASFMCTRPAVAQRSTPVTARRIGVDIGWRRVPEGLRIATVLAADEEPRFITLPEEFIASFMFIDELRARLRAIALQGFELLQRVQIEAYPQPYRELLIEYQSIPDKKDFHLRNFIQSAFFLEQPADAIDVDLRSWRKEFKRISAWLKNHQRKTVGRRNHFYQNVVVDMLENVSEVVANDVKVGEIAARKPLVLDGSFFPNRAHHYRNIAAPSEFIHTIKLQAAKRGINFLKLKVESPVRCPDCGSTSRKTRADALPQICANCDTSFDQDVATCKSLLTPIKRSNRG